MSSRHIVVEKYDPHWISDFEKIKDMLIRALGSLFLSIEHIGSTSVTGLSAKPIIDIDVVIADHTLLQPVISALSTVGYILEGNLGIEGRDAFRYHGTQSLKNHHLYVCPKNSEELHRHIVFRDYLRTHPQAVLEYSMIKEESAALYPSSIDQYMAHKSSCIEKLYRLCGLLSD